jgi:glyceraldehyde 3-phosphate dehydrogenase
MKVKVGINGFGRIGKNFLRAYLESDCNFEVVAINSTSGPEKHAHIFKYDSIYGIYPQKVEALDNSIVIGDKNIVFTAHRDPEQIPWGDMGVEIVIESTGVFTKREGAQKHIKAGAKKVIVTAPAKEEDITIVMGVNHDNYIPSEHHIISNASCTTNCLAPILKVLHQSFGVVKGMMTTVHSYTNDQNILDLPHSDLRRARAANLSIIPTTTGAAQAVAKVLPDLKGKLNGMAMRVPTPAVSVVDFVGQLATKATAEQINEALKNASQGELKDILGYNEDPLVSVDYKQNPLSSIVDGLSTAIIGDDMVKVISWYDNEWGYSSRIADLVNFIIEKGL